MRGIGLFQVHLAEIHRAFSRLREFVWVRATPPRDPAATAPFGVHAVRAPGNKKARRHLR